ncbi:MAG: hypothetical protein PVJ02_09860 [Gemmatimonadota bacterium]
MLKRIRHARIDMKTGIIILVLALLMWGVVTYVRIRDFVPPELKEPVEAPAHTP